VRITNGPFLTVSHPLPYVQLDSPGGARDKRGIRGNFAARQTGRSDLSHTWGNERRGSRRHCATSGRDRRLDSFDAHVEELGMEVWPGTAYPLGATYDGTGTNFAVFSEVADRVELCLFDEEGTETRADLPEVDGFVWHGYVPG